MTWKPDVALSVGLILAGPLFVGIGLLVYWAGGSGLPVAVIEAVGWLGGPAFAVIGAARLWSHGRLRWLPVTRPGRVALWLVGGCGGFFMLFIVALVIGIGPDETPEFFSNLYLAISLLLSGACAVAAAVVAADGVLRHGERSVLAIGCVAFGVVVSVFAMAEIGAEEPGGEAHPRPSPSPTASVAGNSHSNLAARSVGGGTVEVSFDYAFNQDPPGWTIDAITVTALVGDGRPLAGHAPAVRRIRRGSGHMDVVLSFTGEQAAQLRGFSVCFTGPGTPDPNPACATIAFAVAATG